MAHPASVNRQLDHSLDLLWSAGIELTSAMGPQHGLRGDKQDNMIESDDFVDPSYGIPVYSLYGQVRRPTNEMLDSFDVLLFDLQDIGARIYTYLTSLVYLMDACAEVGGKEIWVLDRPNPAGRGVEGLSLNMKFESFVGAVPIPMRHGLTLGELALWYQKHKGLNLEVQVIKMKDYPAEEGWASDFPWVNPSPNVPRLSCTRIFAGTVLLEGTLLSEGRGTTIPLEVVGAPNLEFKNIFERMSKYSKWMEGCRLRPCHFEPTFQKHRGKLCSGFQIHVDSDNYNRETFKPFRLIALFLKSLRQTHPNFEIWRPPPYEYVDDLMPFDILSGSSKLREWIDDDSKDISGLESWLNSDESSWTEERQESFLY